MKRMKQSLTILIIVTAVGLGGCASYSGGSAMTATDQVFEQAAQELAAVRKTGHVWMLLDKATGGKTVTVGKLLNAARDAQNKGDAATAIRLARKVIWAARAGQKQAQDVATTAKYFTSY